MFIHYIKIAFRNMWKYRSQTFISLIGLAVGFTCFALATLWIVYEMTYDSFHKNVKQMYVVYKPSTLGQTGYSRVTESPLAVYLQETFPEITQATSVIAGSNTDKVTVGDVEIPAMIINADSSFLQMFGIKILEGSPDFLIPGSNKRAITQEKARQLFGGENPVGKMVNGDRHEIVAVVSGMSKRSNYAFDIIAPHAALSVDANFKWSVILGENNTIIELLPGINVEAFEKKLYEHEVIAGTNSISKLKVTPISKMRYLDPDIRREFKFQYIMMFAVSGLLVVLCSLFNYLTLFVSRFRIRQKELATRVVFGASDSSLMAMLAIEFILTLGLAVALGFVMTQRFHQPFLTLSEIQMGLPAIYRESLLYIGGIIVVSLPVFWLILFIFRQRSLHVSIRHSNQKLLRKSSIIVQLMISVGFAFCTIVMLKQMYYLHHTDELGFAFQNRGSIVTYNANSDVLANLLKQIPEITETVDANGMGSILPGRISTSVTVGSWDDKPAGAEDIKIAEVSVSPEYIDFYELQLLKGELLSDTDSDSSVLLNESAVQAFGWHDPVGKQFQGRTVKGVIKNVYNAAPTISAKPVYYQNRVLQGVTTTVGGITIRTGITVLFKYQEGTWKSCKEKIEQLKEEYEIRSISSSEELYNDYLKSENALIKLLTFVSAICLLICVFGFVSLVSLTCEERRKEIAIRKINGAMTGDILSMFTKEYSLLLMIGSVIAFSTGYFIIQRWLENYVKQTGIPAWIYLSILFTMALVIVLCVGWQVYKASVENPAEVVKSE